VTIGDLFLALDSARWDRLTFLLDERFEFVEPFIDGIKSSGCSRVSWRPGLVRYARIAGSRSNPRLEIEGTRGI